MRDKSSLSLSHASLSVFPIRRNGGGIHLKREERRLAHMREQVHHHFFVRILLEESPQGGLSSHTDRVQNSLLGTFASRAYPINPSESANWRREYPRSAYLSQLLHS